MWSPQRVTLLGLITPVSVLARPVEAGSLYKPCKFGCNSEIDPFHYLICTHCLGYIAILLTFLGLNFLIQKMGTNLGRMEELAYTQCFQQALRRAQHPIWVFYQEADCLRHAARLFRPGHIVSFCTLQVNIAGGVMQSDTSRVESCLYPRFSVIRWAGYLDLSSIHEDTTSDSLESTAAQM